jgi:ABC-type transporter Mla MlaB component
MTPTPRLTLPPDLCIADVGALVPHWLSWLDRHAPDAPREATVDAAAVQEVDSAGLQLLVSLGHAIEARGWTLQLVDVPAPLTLACQQLGLGAWLAGRLAAVTEPSA